MPTPEENMQSVRAFAEEVFGNKNLDSAAEWLAYDFVEHQVFPGTTPDKKGAIDSYRIFFAASPDMTAGIHDMIAIKEPSLPPKKCTGGNIRLTKNGTPLAYQFSVWASAYSPDRSPPPCLTQMNGSNTP
jgi:hypothetical protein